MVAKALYADPVQIDAPDFRRRNGEPCLQLAIIQMNFLQLLYSVEAAYTLPLVHYRPGYAAAYAGNFLQFSGICMI